MKNKNLPITIAFVGALSASCGMMDEHAAVDPELSAAADEKLDVAIASTQIVTEAIKDYAFAQRAQFASDRKAEMARIQTELDQLSVKADNAVRTDLETKLEAVRAKWAEAKQLLDKAESATEPDWSAVQRSFNKSYGELHTTFDEARRWLSDEIDPETGQHEDTANSEPKNSKGERDESSLQD